MTMLLHLRPKMLLPHSQLPADLVDLRVEPVGLHLRGGVELAARRPYPNKRYLVACRKAGRKAINGLLVEVGEWQPKFRYVARWAVGAEFVVTHSVTLTLLDADFDLASDDMIVFWNRRDPELHNLPPIRIEPRIEALTPGDTLDQHFSIPTIERETFATEFLHERLPAFADAFHIA